MAIGDSITAAYAAEDPWPFPTNPFALHEWHGDSFSIGGKPGAITIPNIIANVSGTTVIGASVLQDATPFQVPNDGLNVAFSGARAASSPDYTTNFSPLQQAGLLYYRLTNVYTTVSLPNDWKLLTIFIGTNDICESCLDPSYNSTTFAQSLNATLAYLSANIPHLFVNLVGGPDVTQYNNFFNYPNGLYPYDSCLETHPVHCPCACNYNLTNFAQFQATQLAYRQQLQALATYWTTTVPSNEFAVVYQPILTQSVYGLRTWLAVDCFHPTSLTHEALAAGLWNNMITPAKKKRTAALLDPVTGEPAEVVTCPTHSTIFPTN